MAGVNNLLNFYRVLAILSIGVILAGPLIIIGSDFLKRSDNTFMFGVFWLICLTPIGFLFLVLSIALYSRDQRDASE